MVLRLIDDYYIFMTLIYLGRVLNSEAVAEILGTVEDGYLLRDYKDYNI